MNDFSTRRAAVLGVNGQDGSYLAETLMRRGYAVLGIGRQPCSRHVRASDRFSYLALDLQQADALERSIADYDPDLAFHAAAVHGSAGFSYEPLFRAMMAVNVLALHVLLEHARTRRHNLRIIYANSAKVFRAPLEGLVDEESPRTPSCLYGIGKLAAAELIEQYRERHGISATNLYLFNHESPRRPEGYFVPAIVRAIAAARRVRRERANLHTLSFRMDWGSASELMDIAVDIAERAPATDFVLASGRTWDAREAVDAAFRQYGLDYRDHLWEAAARCDPGPDFKVSLARLERAIGRVPTRDFLAVVREMLEETLSASPSVRPLADRARTALDGASD
jgi:GDPmannose 4,6-dehydratase